MGVLLGDLSSLRDRESRGDSGEKGETDEGGGRAEEHFGEGGRVFEKVGREEWKGRGIYRRLG